MDRSEFVLELGELLRKAKPHLISCELKVDGYVEIVVVTCENGYTYVVHVTGNSLAAIAYDVFAKMLSK